MQIAGGWLGSENRNGLVDGAVKLGISDDVAAQNCQSGDMDDHVVLVVYDM